jgi:hypothetical protein
MSQPAQKIYAFVDESGQETNGALFLVSVVVTDQEYERINEILIGIEDRSGKREPAKSAQSQRAGLECIPEPAQTWTRAARRPTHAIPMQTL